MELPTETGVIQRFLLTDFEQDYFSSVLGCSA